MKIEEKNNNKKLKYMNFFLMNWIKICEMIFLIFRCVDVSLFKCYLMYIRYMYLYFLIWYKEWLIVIKYVIICLFMD